MADFDDIAGKIGDTSGKIGDTSGRTMEEVQRDIVRGRLIEQINCLESRVTRIDGDMLRIAKMLDARLSVLEERILESQIEDLVRNRLKDIQDHIQRVEDKVNSIPFPGNT